MKASNLSTIGLALATCPKGHVAGRSTSQFPHATLHDFLSAASMKTLVVALSLVMSSRSRSFLTHRVSHWFDQCD